MDGDNDSLEAEEKLSEEREGVADKPSGDHEGDPTIAEHHSTDIVEMSISATAPFDESSDVLETQASVQHATDQSSALFPTEDSSVPSPTDDFSPVQADDVHLGTESGSQKVESLLEGQIPSHITNVADSDGLTGVPPTESVRRPPAPPPSMVGFSSSSTVEDKEDIMNVVRKLENIDESADAAHLEDIDESADVKQLNIDENEGPARDKLENTASVEVSSDDDVRQIRVPRYVGPDELKRRISQTPDPNLTPSEVEFPPQDTKFGPYPVWSIPGDAENYVLAGHTDSGTRALSPTVVSSSPPTTARFSDGEDNREIKFKDGIQIFDVGIGDFALDKKDHVLPPEDPLMERYQSALKAYLLRQINKAELGLREHMKIFSTRQKEREQIGVEVYERQNQLARLNMQLEQLKETLTEAQNRRQQSEADLEKTAEQYNTEVQLLLEERGKEDETRQEVDQLEMHEFHLKSLEMDADTQLQTQQKMAERAEQEMSALEKDKRRQDYLITRLSRDVEHVESRIEMYDVQIEAQGDETKVTKQVISEAQLELDMLAMEKKHLMKTWTHSLMQMKNCDERHSEMLDETRKLTSDLHTIQSEVNAYFKSIDKAQEENEGLYLQEQRLKQDCNKFQRLFDKTMEKFGELKLEYEHFQCILQQTEQTLAEAYHEQKMVRKKLAELLFSIEKQIFIKRTGEDAIAETLQNRLTADSAEKYTKKIVQKTRDITKLKETQVADVENDIAHVMLATSNISTSINYVKAMIDDLRLETKALDGNCDKFRQEIHNNNILISRKQVKIQEFNKKIGTLVGLHGGMDLGPYEMQIAGLHKSLLQADSKLKDAQQFYIRLQNELVFMIRERDSKAELVETRRKEITIMDNRKTRMEHTIEREEKEMDRVVRSISRLQEVVERLNSCLAKERTHQDNLETDNALCESQYCYQLKEMEMECIKLRTQIRNSECEKNASVADMGQSAEIELLWDQKLKQIREAKQRLQQELGHTGEVMNMKLEIHRMEVRLHQLFREQERLITEMERSVYRRESISAQAELADVTNRTASVRYFLRQKKLEDLRRKMKTIGKDASHLLSEEQRITNFIEEQKNQIPCAHECLNTARAEIDRLQRAISKTQTQKAENLYNTLLKQHSSKYYQNFLDGRYQPLFKSVGRITNELEELDTQEASLRLLLMNLTQEHPDMEYKMRHIVNLLTHPS